MTIKLKRWNPEFDVLIQIKEVKMKLKEQRARDEIGKEQEDEDEEAEFQSFNPTFSQLLVKGIEKRRNKFVKESTKKKDDRKT